jgi:hypothetical protein
MSICCCLSMMSIVLSFFFLCLSTMSLREQVMLEVVEVVWRREEEG